MVELLVEVMIWQVELIVRQLALHGVYTDLLRLAPPFLYFEE